MKKILAFTLAFLLVLPIFGAVIPYGVFADDGVLITETTDSYKESFGYGGYIVRSKSDGSIMMSPYLSQLEAALKGGSNIDNYTVEMTFTLLDGKGGNKVHTYDTVSSSIKKGNGSYFDICLNGSLGNTGFCPTAGKFYDIEVNIFTGYGSEKPKRAFYGTYKSAEIPSTIKTSKYYKPTSIPSDPSDFKISVAYSFNNTLAGSAAGKITVTSDTPGDFQLMWGDANGKPLTAKVGDKTLKYSPLSSFKISSVNGGSYVQNVLGFTAIPVGAKTLLVTDTSKTVLKSVEIPKDKLLAEKAPNYSFGIVSDVHYNYFFDSTKTIDYAEAAFDTALAFYKAAGVKLVAATGDYSLYGEEESYKEFHNAVEKSGLLVIACGGNHELYAKLDVMFGKNGYWRTYMNDGIYDGSVEGVLDIADNGIDFTYSIPGVDDAVFVSLSQWYWDGHTPAQEKLVEPEQLVWLEKQFEAHKDKTVYLLFHTYLSDDDHENIDGQGDLTSKGGYSYGGHYNEYTDDEKTFRSLLTKYDNVIWYNGHSHYEYSMQMHNDNVNIFNYQGTTATMVHVPSVTNPRTVEVNGTSYGSLYGTASQGGLQFVYDGYEIMNGVDLWGEEILSYACYIIYTDDSNIIDSGKIPNTEIEWTYDAQLNSLRILGVGDLGGITSSNAPWSKYAKEIMTLYIGSGIQSIGKNLFNNLTNLEKAEIKDGLVTIGEGAFANTKLSQLILPATLKTVEKDAFSGIEKIKQIIFAGTAEKWATLSLADGNSCLDGTVSFKSVKITFVLDDETWVVDVNMGEIPQFNMTPTKVHEDPNKHYPFKGWTDGTKVYSPSQSLPSATKNAKYTPVFGAATDRYVTGKISNGMIKWTIDRNTATLTIEGRGILSDFADPKDQPWAKYKNEIRKVVVKTGITAVGKNSFSRLPVLTSVVLEEGVKSIKMDAFAHDDVLIQMSLPASLSAIGQGIVFGSENIKTIYYGGSEKQWQSFCAGITTMYNDILTKCKNVKFNGGSDDCYHVASRTIGYNTTNHWSLCSICEQKFKNEEHAMGQWVITKMPTESEDGSKERVCSCGLKEVAVATMADLEQATPTQTPSATPNATGTANGAGAGSNANSNSTTIVIIVIICVIVVVGVGAAIVIMKKRKA